LANVPGDYVETYKQYTRQGARVLALAYKFLDPDMGVSSHSLPVGLWYYWSGYLIWILSCLEPKPSRMVCLTYMCITNVVFLLEFQVGEARTLERETVESYLTFAGFAVCSSIYSALLRVLSKDFL
jgi:magnesium-transporting ATPase (P-type)